MGKFGMNSSECSKRSPSLADPRALANSDLLPARAFPQVSAVSAVPAMLRNLQIGAPVILALFATLAALSAIASAATYTTR